MEELVQESKDEERVSVKDVVMDLDEEVRHADANIVEVTLAMQPNDGTGGEMDGTGGDSQLENLDYLKERSARISGEFNPSSSSEPSTIVDGALSIQPEKDKSEKKKKKQSKPKAAKELKAADSGETPKKHSSTTKKRKKSTEETSSLVSSAISEANLDAVVLSSPSKSSNKKPSSAAKSSTKKGTPSSQKKAKPRQEHAGDDLSSHLEDNAPVTPVAGGKIGQESTAKKKRASPGVMSSATKKKKIAELEESIATFSRNIESLRKEETKLDKSIKAAATRALKSAALKYPIKDEQLAILCADSPPLGIPQPRYPFSLPSEMFGDVICIWEFLNTFKLQLSLPKLPLEDLIDILTFTHSESSALTEIFCAPLRIILCDHHLSTKLQSSIPKYTSFTHRPTAAEIAYFAVNKDAIRPIPAGGDVQGLVSAFGPASVDVDIDCAYNGLHLLPRRLLPRLVDPLRWQSVLRCILLKLEPVNALQRSFRTVPVPVLSLLFASSTAGVNISAVPGSPLSKSRSFTAETRSPISTRISSEGRLISTPGASNRSKKNAQINKDVVLGITSQSTEYISNICDAALELENRELHTLTVKHKVTILKTLCDACYETAQFRELLENNAEERANSILAMNKTIKETKLRQKEVSAAKRDVAIQACRDINMKAAAEAAAAVASKKSRKKKSSANASESTKGGKGSGTDSLIEAVAGGDSSIKGSKKAAKDPYEPSAAQLAAMLDDMLLLESVGVDEVIDDISIEIPEELSNEPEVPEEALLLGRAFSKGERTKEQERRRQRLELAARSVAVNNAKAMLSSALESGIEKDIKRAIRAAEKAELRWTDDNDRVYCTELLKQAYKVHATQEAKAKEERELADYEKDLLKFCTRTVPLGFDRYNSVYWRFAECPFILFVQRPILSAAKGNKGSSGVIGAGVSSAVAVVDQSSKRANVGANSNKSQSTSLEKLRAAMLEVTSEDQSSRSSSFQRLQPLLMAHFGKSLPLAHLEMLMADPSLIMLYQSRPNQIQYEWGVYCSNNALWSLWEALDDRGERERELKAAIKANFDISEPPIQYLTTGSEYIGKHVRRVFSKKVVIGTVVGWLPAEGDDVALWHVEHLDGDEEDLEEHEIRSFLVKQEDDAGSAGGTKSKLSSSSSSQSLSSLHSVASSSSPSKRHSPVPLAVEASDGSRRSPRSSDLFRKSSIEGEDEWNGESNLVVKPKKRGVNSDVHVLEGSSAGSESPAAESVEEIEIPKIIKSFTGVGKNHVPVKGFMIGLPGLKTELLRCFQLLVDALKKKAPDFNKEARRAWEVTVKESECLGDIQDALLELEAIARSAQIEVDVQDEEEIAKEKEAAKLAMMAEGWQFESSANEFIGLPARRFFNRHGMSDGVIVAYMPAEKNDGLAVWHMEHEDGDEEDLYEADVRKSLRQREEDLKEDDDAEVNPSDDEKSESGSESESETEGEEEAVVSKRKKKDVESCTLWPTAGVRSRWITAVQRANTIGEVALAISAFMDFALNFGIVADDPLDIVYSTATSVKDRKFQSNARLSYCGPPSASSRGALSPHKRKGAYCAHEYSDRGRLKRQATRNVSYIDD